MDARPEPTGPSWPQAEPWPQPYVEPPPPEEETRDTDVELGLHGEVYIDGGYRHAPGGYSPPAGGAQAWRGSPPTGPGMTPAGGWQGKPPSGGGISGWRLPAGSSGGGGGCPCVPSPGRAARAAVWATSARVAAAATAARRWSCSRCAGGDRRRDDGQPGVQRGHPLRRPGAAVAMAARPSQTARRRRAGIALGDLSPVAIEGAVEAKVMDDEGYGIRTLDHFRLDRRWAPTFKLDAGSMTFARSGTVRSGFVSNMQVGLFVRPWLGLLLTAGVGGAGDEYGATITRHVFGFEAQSLPLALGPVQLGGYVNVGAAAIASTATGSGPSSGATRSAPASWASCRSRRGWRSRCAPARTRRSSPTAARRHPPPPSPPASHFISWAGCGRPRAGGGWRRRPGRRQ